MKALRPQAFLLALTLAVPWSAPTLSAQEDPPAAEEDAPKPKKKAKKGGKGKKGYDYEASKYKSYRTLSDNEPRSYRFDESGKPIPPGGKKKPAKKKKKVEAPPAEDEIDGNVPLSDEKSCDGDQSCQDAPAAD